MYVAISVYLDPTKLDIPFQDGLGLKLYVKRADGGRRDFEDVGATHQTVPCDLWGFISGEDSVDKDMIRKSLRARKTLWGL